MGKISDSEIESAKKRTIYSLKEQLHQHNDCIRIAYEWLDAQKKIKKPSKISRPLKHLIENWGGRYISTSDVEVAAELHKDITGTYSHYNISSRLTEPSLKRLKDIKEASTQGQRESHKKSNYKYSEDNNGNRIPIEKNISK